MQSSIFDILSEPSELKPVVFMPKDWRDYDSGTAEISDYGVVLGDIETIIQCPNPRKGWRGLPWAEIGVHPFTQDLWMWSTSWCFERAGGSYRAGPSGRKFAETKQDAIFYAKEEMKSRIEHQENLEPKPFKAVMEWLETI